MPERPSRYIDSEIVTPTGQPYTFAVCSHCQRQISGGATACSYHPFAGTTQLDVVSVRRARPVGRKPV